MVNNMKVYLVYNDAEDGNSVIDKVFDTERKALDYAIKKYYSGPKYRICNQNMLDDNASGDIEEMELE